ncbi:uncharacterized protein LOC121968323 isoform X2 [Zingiber officinale]|uniref:DUF4408 domain-containing protein n=1 Tax=Zingiber officinale TaxID=94328 RepID=A0A8J5HCA0_ZINOF|nr:uncharacterized protein LOC121968323 isoform X2 [Zingiber officinale]KAG6518397.1 hypothetical protein ZIOFF_021872 [Zingiber officinale]
MLTLGNISFVIIIAFSTALLARLLIPYSSVDLRKSTSLHRLWITTQLIVLIIWKIFPAKSDANQPPQSSTEIDLPPDVEESPPEMSWSSAPPHEPEPEVPIATEHPSMDDAWKSIDKSGGKRVLTKSETWEPRGRREVERAAALRRTDTAMLKTEKKRWEEVHVWRALERQVESQEELFQRVETFIKKHYDHLRLQKQESERRRFLERQLLPQQSAVQ